MIKRTLFFSNPAHLYKRNEQLCVSMNKANETEDETKVVTIPIEDIGVVVLDNKQITLSHALIDALLQNNAALISCDDTHMPSGLMLPLAGNTLQTEKFKAQINASEPLKKQLWQQTVSAKLKNQGKLLFSLAQNPSTSLRMTRQREQQLEDAAAWLLAFAKEVKSGDTDNHEARGAAIYWQNIFPAEMNFRRDRFGEIPNNLLNYGYSILRGVVARGLVASGAMPTLGIFHRNKYNAYCLADDIMEPYRPYVDKIVCRIMNSGEDWQELTPAIKKYFLEIPALDIVIDGEQSPLMVGLQRTTAGLMKCFEGEGKKLLYPELQ
jgi:CRISPR-associated protein Cas1